MITSSSGPFFADKYRMKCKYFFLAVLCGFMLNQAAAQTRPTPVILEEIYELLSEFNFSEAIALFDTIGPSDAESTPIMLLRASVLNSAGRTNDARRLIEAVSVREPENLEALYVLSVIEAMSGKSREQRTILEKIISINPRHVNALSDLGSNYLQTRSFSNATGYFDKALEVDPGNLNALLGKAAIYRFARDPYNAEAMLNLAVSFHPEEAGPYHERARLYLGAGFPIQALADLDKARDLDRYDYSIAIDRGNTLLDLYRKEQALEEFERAVSINPREYLAYAFTAGIKDEFGDYDGAERDYEILARLKPDYYFAFEGVGIHKMRRGQWAEARDAFMEVYRQAPNEYYYALLAAVCWMRADNLAGPRQFLNQVMSKVRRDSIEYYIIRLFYDLTGRVYNGENDMLRRVDAEQNPETKARMLFYLGQYYDVRGNQNLANRYFSQSGELNKRSLPEWRLNDWICIDRGLVAIR